MSFACPHFRPDDECCLRLETDCVPGRAGCVLGGKAVFAVPAEQRVREREEEKRLAPGLAPEAGVQRNAGDRVVRVEPGSAQRKRAQVR